jgi:hypothetical protein
MISMIFLSSTFFSYRLGLMEKAPSAQESRKAAESVARHCLDRLKCESNLEDSSLGPWQNAIVINPNVETDKWLDTDDISLRNHVSKLKGLRSSIQNTVVTLESPFSVDESQMDELTSPGGSGRGRSKHDRRMDLETAVLMQELMSMREDVSELKYKAELAEREKSIAQQKLLALKEALVHLQAQLACCLWRPKIGLLSRKLNTRPALNESWLRHWHENHV